MNDSEFSAGMSERDFNRLRGFIHSECGIKMPESKRSMLAARLQKRLRALSLKSFGEYCDYLFSPDGLRQELIHLIDAVTTNKTDFFREPKHFEYLVHSALPALVNGGGTRKVKLWSAGCSTGEEPYTLAMFLSDFSERCSKFDFSILATDVSTRALETARRGIYPEDRTEPVPAAHKKKYFMRSKDRGKGLVRVIPELRARVEFRRVNFMDGDFGIHGHMDIIFCRNVIIYFDRQTQEALLRRLCNHLAPGGYVFMGHSETLNGLDAPLTQVYPTVYMKKT